MDLDEVRQGFLDAGFAERLIDEVLSAYTETKRRYHLGDHRPGEVEGGRFAEGVFRMLQLTVGLKMTPLNRSLPGTDKLLPQFEQASEHPDSVRIHIPRTLLLIYDIRNRRDAAHLADGIDPNLQDATLVVGNMDWVLAELVRLHHGVEPDEAQKIIENLVVKEVPAIQEIDGQPVILSDLKPREQALLMLYRAGAHGISLGELAGWLRVDRKDHLRDRLEKLDEDHLVFEHPASARFYITDRGSRHVERKGLAQPAD
jgi:hypothetical protein